MTVGPITARTPRLRISRSWLPLVVGRDIRENPRVIDPPAFLSASAFACPLPAIRVAGWDARLIGIEVRLAPIMEAQQVEFDLSDEAPHLRIVERIIDRVVRLRSR